MVLWSCLGLSPPSAVLAGNTYNTIFVSFASLPCNLYFPSDFQTFFAFFAFFLSLHSFFLCCPDFARVPPHLQMTPALPFPPSSHHIDPISPSLPPFSLVRTLTLSRSRSVFNCPLISPTLSLSFSCACGLFPSGLRVLAARRDRRPRGLTRSKYTEGQGEYQACMGEPGN